MIARLQVVQDLSSHPGPNWFGMTLFGANPEYPKVDNPRLQIIPIKLIIDREDLFSQKIHREQGHNFGI